MVDTVDKATRSRMMAGIRGTNTRPEIRLRKALHARGFRFRLHDLRLPGRPDIVLPRFRAALFVHGCFWHRHLGCRYATTPATRTSFWEGKFASNVARDARNLHELKTAGWRTAIVWECALRSRNITHTINQLAAWIYSGEQDLELPNLSSYSES